MVVNLKYYFIIYMLNDGGFIAISFVSEIEWNQE